MSNFSLIRTTIFDNLITSTTHFINLLKHPLPYHRPSHNRQSNLTSTQKPTRISSSQKINRQQDIPSSIKPNSASKDSLHSRFKQNRTQKQEQQSLIKKKERLMSEMKKINYELKRIHYEDYLTKLRKSNELKIAELQQQQRAAELVRKMNNYRKLVLSKRRNADLSLYANVKQSLQKIRQRDQQYRQHQLLKKKQIQQRIHQRKLHILQRQKMNKMTNNIIKQLKTYKCSLPQISYKQFDHNDIMLTVIKTEDLGQRAEERTRIVSWQRPRESQTSGRMNSERSEKKLHSKVLENIYEEKMMREREELMKKQRSRRVRESHQEYGKNLRLRKKERTD